jgi:hypothetical protein
MYTQIKNSALLRLLVDIGPTVMVQSYCSGPSLAYLLDLVHDVYGMDVNTNKD